MKYVYEFNMHIPLQIMNIFIFLIIRRIKYLINIIEQSIQIRYNIYKSHFLNLVFLIFQKGNDHMNHNNVKKILTLALCLSFTFNTGLPAVQFFGNTETVTVKAEGSVLHDTSRDIQKEGVGNPLNFGERNTPENGSDEEIRAINHKMTVQEVKYAMYKEIDEHWDLIRVRFGIDNREMVYAIFCGLGSRESTLGGNGDGADLETAQGQGFGVSSAHAYGTMQTAVTAFKDCDPTFMPEDDVPEMYQYTLTHANFYDAIISNHMGIRKLMHFVRSAFVDYNLEGYQVVRAALKAFNTGWANYTSEEDGYYKNYPDEIVAMAHWYYDEGHLYDNEFTWTQDEKLAKYRQDYWGWLGDVHPSLDEIKENQTTEQQVTEETVVTEPPVSETQAPESETTADTSDIIYGDVDLNGIADLTDLSKLSVYLMTKSGISAEGLIRADVQYDGTVDIADLAKLKQYVSKDKVTLGPQ